MTSAPLLREGANDEQLQTHLQTIWSRRVDRYSELRHAHTPQRPKIEMSYLGG